MGGDNLAAKGKLDLLAATASSAGTDSATKNRNVSALHHHSFLASIKQPSTPDTYVQLF
jgi:hypothetical protein